MTHTVWWPARRTSLWYAAAAALVLLPAVPATAAPAPVRAVCDSADPGDVHCLAQVRTDVHAGLGVRGPDARSAALAELPPGYGPSELRAAYHLPAEGGTGQTIAVVEAGDDPQAEADLAVYRTTFGLPPCTTANGCFRKANQRGDAAPLPPDLGWGVEAALDLDAASALCPSCHLLLVEADQAAGDTLAASVDTAAALGATEISNSYAASESNQNAAFAAHYTHPGVAVVASSGDAGYGIPSVPAAYQSVITAGGTTLTAEPGSARGWTESAWAGAGSGCSAWVDKPSWQHDPNCPGRMTSDVSMDADPETGLAVYTTDETGGQAAGWTVVGGTSASSPMLAAVIALAGHPGRFPDASRLYTAASGLTDVATGSNAAGMDCGGDYQCTAVPGYDGPTGNGTPLGLTAF
ncbi:S53 family peptidase [Actinacidiphila bryophytorum]|uniref:S53 family peptidase n=1 Tax=Actinacidiphila bryophytorum TaxID=1436133 RepID=UPI00217695E1|nr:peptidase S8 [Actinacidiphila bryophytorum]UWE07749.1 peptidase S8 [Actinacidiphila bryophytorum]